MRVCVAVNRGDKTVAQVRTDVNHPDGSIRWLECACGRGIAAACDTLEPTGEWQAALPRSSALRSCVLGRRHSERTRTYSVSGTRDQCGALASTGAGSTRNSELIGERDGADVERVGRR